MQKIISRAVLASLLTLGAGVAVAQEPAAPATPAAPAAKAASGVIAAMQGKTMVLKDGKLVAGDAKQTAKYTILYFSASWCGPCRANAPHSVKSYNAAVVNNPDVEVVMCSCDRDAASAEKWAAKENMPWPFILGKDWSLIPAVKAVSPRGIPTMILVDAEGKVISTGRNIEQLIQSAK